MARPPFEKPLRWYTWHRKFYWTYWTRYEWYNNPHFNNEEWHCWEEWAVFIGFKPKGSKWFAYEDHYYDGMTCQMVVFAGLAFGKCYGYDARPVKDVS